MLLVIIPVVMSMLCSNLVQVLRCRQKDVFLQDEIQNTESSSYRDTPVQLT